MMNDPGPSGIDRSKGAVPLPAVVGSDQALPAGTDARAMAAGEAAERLDLFRRRFEATLEGDGDPQPAPGDPMVRTSLQDVVDLLADSMRPGSGPSPVAMPAAASGGSSAVGVAWTGAGAAVSVEAERPDAPGGSAGAAALRASPEAVALPAKPAAPAGERTVVPGPAQAPASPGAPAALPERAASEPAAIPLVSDAPGETERLFAQAAADAAQALATRWVSGAPELQAPATAATGPADRVWQQVEAAATRMQVAPSLAGGQQVRLDIDPRLLPGVQVVLQFAGGRLQMDFICSQEASRRRLRAVAGRELAGAAGRLGVDVLMSLRSDASDESAAEFMHAAA